MLTSSGYRHRILKQMYALRSTESWPEGGEPGQVGRSRDVCPAQQSGPAARQPAGNQRKIRGPPKDLREAASAAAGKEVGTRPPDCSLHHRWVSPR